MPDPGARRDAAAVRGFDGVEVAAATTAFPWLARATDRISQRFGDTATTGALTLADQAIVSGTSFATTVLLGRVAGPEELGIYALAGTVVIMVASFQDTLVSVPYTIYVTRLKAGERPVYAGSTLLQAAILAALAMLGLAAAGVLLSSDLGPARLTTVIWPLTIAIPALLLRDFFRRLSFAHRRVDRALALDAAVMAMQALGLGVVVYLGVLSARSAYAVIAAASAAGVLAAYGLARGGFGFERARLGPDAARHWMFGRWVFGSRLLANLNSDVLLTWIVGFALGTAATGLFAACMTIVFFSNPFILGVGYVLTPRISRAAAEGGPKEVRRVVRKTALAIALVMIVFVAAAALVGNTLLVALYGPMFAGHGSVIVALGLSVLAASTAMAPGNGLWALDRPDLTVRAGLLGLVTTATMALLLVGPLGVLGAACALAAGSTIEAIARTLMFGRLVARAAQEASPS
jgi:O-antigen/teichoic acid export membrane protein